MNERVTVADLLMGLRDLIEHRDFEADCDQLIDCSKTQLVGLTPRIMMAIRDITSTARGAASAYCSIGAGADDALIFSSPARRRREI